MASYLAWGIFVGVGAALGFVGYHFSVRSVRWVSAVAALGLAAAVAAYGLRHTAPAPANVQSAFALGADQVAAALFRPFGFVGSVPPGRVGWAVIAALLVLGYRELEAWALHWQAPQLDTSKLDQGQPSIAPAGGASAAAAPADGLTDGQRHDLLAAEVRFRLAAMEVRSPAILPGGSRSGGLATIAEASGVSGAGLAGAIIRFFGMLWPTPRQVQLRVWVEQTPGGPPPSSRHPTGPARVTVELSDPATGATQSTQTLAAASPDEAAVRVAGYVARQIFGMDPATPPWCFGAPDGEDLSALLLSRQRRVSIETPHDLRTSRAEEISLLRGVAEATLCAGVVRYDLALLYGIQGMPYEDHLAALRLHAVNRDQYPRFYRGRYRLAMSLEMVADPGFAFANRAEGLKELSGTLNVLHRSQLTTRRRCEDDDIQPGAGGDGWQLAPALRLELLTAAAAELRAVRRQLTVPRLLWSSFAHRGERGIWRPYYLGLRLRQSFHDGVCVAELLVAARLRATAAAMQAERGSGAAFAEGPTRRHLKLGIRVAAAVAGSDDLMNSVSIRPGDQNPSCPWPPPPEPSGLAASINSARRRSAPRPPRDARDRVRRLPWQRRTASWQAAYNTACLYAPLISHRVATQASLSALEQAQLRGWEDRVVMSLERVAGNPHAEMRRPYDVIAADSDFSVLQADPERFPDFTAFLAGQRQKDYPDAPASLRPTLTSVEPA